MTSEQLTSRLGEITLQEIPSPALGETAERHRLLMAIGREDLTLAKLAEAHWDAVAILREAGRTPEPGKLYGVWASKIPGKALELERTSTGYRLSGSKPFCSGLGLVDRALITSGAPHDLLLDVDLRIEPERLHFDTSQWSTSAFALTATGALTFDSYSVSEADAVGEPGWYLTRPGFWHGACGPAACWAGGAAGLVDFAAASNRSDPHTLAHLGAMQASVWAMQAILDQAGSEIDADPADSSQAHRRALIVRHLIETHCSDILRRLPRAYGPHPLAMNADVSQRYHELELYLRQSHAERDLEALGCSIRA